MKSCQELGCQYAGSGAACSDYECLFPPTEQEVKQEQDKQVKDAERNCKECKEHYQSYPTPCNVCKDRFI